MVFWKLVLSPDCLRIDPIWGIAEAGIELVITDEEEDEISIADGDEDSVTAVEVVNDAAVVEVELIADEVELVENLKVGTPSCMVGSFTPWG